MRSRTSTGTSRSRVGAAIVALALMACAEAVNTVPRCGRGIPAAPAGMEVEALRPADYSALQAGEALKRPMVVERGGQRYVGGVAYQLIDAPADVVYAALQEAGVMERVLPKTKQITLLARRSNTWQVELRQGNEWVDVAYSVVFREAAPRSLGGAGEPAARVVDFWLDTRRPHDIADVWGFFAVQPYGSDRSLVSLGALVDLGSSFGRLFEGDVQRLILSTPGNIGQYFRGELWAQAGPER